MDANRFDSISRFLANRRISRRDAVVKGSSALAATGLAAAGLSRTVAAQDATPTAETGMDTSGVEMLFVQTYKAGTIAPIDGSDDRYTLTLESGVGQTMYFSDRPDRIVGVSPNQEFIDTLGFPDDNPPNAALVFEQAPGNTDIAVVELFTPVFDESTGGMTYEISVLKNWQTELEMGFAETPTDLTAINPEFGAAHLFIDGIWDCPDRDLTCYIPDSSKQRGMDVKGSISNEEHSGFCVSRPQLICYPCTGPEAGGNWQDECNRRFSDCNGQCLYSPSCVTMAGNQC